MKNLTNIAMLLGDDNAKRLKDGITDLLLEQVDADLNDRYRYEYILSFDALFEEVRDKIAEEFKEKLTEVYRKHMEEKLRVVESSLKGTV